MSDDDAADPRVHPLLHRELGGYRLIRHWADGGFGALYLAEHILEPERVVVVKTLLPKYTEGTTNAKAEWYRQRFLKECRALAKLKHEYIVDVITFGIDEEDGLHYLVMERLDGETLHEVLDREGKLELPQVVTIVAQIASAVQAIHDAEIIHRDLTPKNVFLVKTKTGRIWVKIIDFGLAHDANAEGDRTNTGAVFGTIAYMAFEQLRDSSRVTLQADVFSLAVMCFQMLTGRLPWVPLENPALQLEQIKTLPEPPPKAEMPADVREVVFKGLLHVASSRQKSVREFAMRLAGTIRNGAQIVQRAAEDLCWDVPHDERTLRGMSAKAQAAEQQLSPRLAVQGPSLAEILAAVPRKTPMMHARVSERQVRPAHVDGTPEVTQNLRGAHAALADLVAGEATLEEPTVEEAIAEPSEWPRHSHHVNAPPVDLRPSAERTTAQRPAAERTTARPVDAQPEPNFAQRPAAERTTARTHLAQPAPQFALHPATQRTTDRPGDAQPVPRVAAMFSVAQPLVSQGGPVSEVHQTSELQTRTEELEAVPEPAPQSVAPPRFDRWTVALLAAAIVVVVVCAGICTWALVLR